MTESEELEFEVDFTSSLLDAVIIQGQLRAISNVADVLFEPSLTFPYCTGTFADGQRISFDPFKVDWEQLERTCRFWSESYLDREFANAISQSSHKYIMEKMRLNEKYGRIAK